MEKYQAKAMKMHKIFEKHLNVKHQRTIMDSIYRIVDTLLLQDQQDVFENFRKHSL